MEYSEYQLNIFKTFKHTTNNLVITAVAGSGKTTTMLKLLKFSSKMKRTSIMLAFNKSIVEELKNKSGYSNIQTFHSYCLSIIKQRNNNIIINDNKVEHIIEEVGIKINETHKYNIIRLVNLYRQSLANDMEGLVELNNHHGIDIDNNYKTVMRIVEYIDDYNIMNEDKDDFMIDFIDMISIVAHDDTIIHHHYDDIFIDESQDMNSLQHMILSKMLNKNNRFIAVGDPNQSIYGFMGADNESYSKLLEHGNITELPLSYCYRCGTSIVSEANKLYSNMVSPDTQHEGTVSRINGSDILNIDRSDTYLESSIIICRYNLSIFQLYMKLKDEGIKCNISSDIISKRMITYIKSFNKTEKDDIIKAMRNRLNYIEKKMIKNGISEPEKTVTYTYHLDMILIIEEYFNRYHTLDEVLLKITETTYETGGISLMSTHRTKGLEADNVYIFGINHYPSVFSFDNQYQLKQEKNLLYVALTRAKNNLYIINSEDPYIEVLEAIKGKKYKKR